MTNDNRSVTEPALETILVDLACICATASSLAMSLEPLSDEDQAAGAEPLTSEQVAESLETISQLAKVIALTQLKAEPAEWYAANDKIE